MAEYDQFFLERMWEMGYEDMLAYLHSLPEAERKAMTEAINKAISLRAVRDHIDYLSNGLMT